MRWSSTLQKPSENEWSRSPGWRICGRFVSARPKRRAATPPGTVRRDLRCSSRPQLAGEIDRDSPLNPFHIWMHGARAASLCVYAKPGPVEGLELELLEGRWRVIDHRGFGFA
jgi:hypothetical protein